MKIKVCFYIDFEAQLPRALVNRMRKDPSFEVSILVIPYRRRGEIDFESLIKNYEILQNEFGDIVLCSYENGDFKEFKDFDYVCIVSPYDNATHPYYTMKHIAGQNMKIFYITYGYIVSNWYEKYCQKLDFSHIWKYFVECDFSYWELLNKTNITKEQLVLSGYAKMDGLYHVVKKNRTRKSIIIAFHHTIFDKGVYFSNFLEYADFIQELPKIYPDIDFILRPHPLLLGNLLRDDVWGENKTRDYFLNLANMPNMTYQEGGDYFEAFANSDALIHDCGSFMAEYLYTNNPVCYLLKDSKTNDNNYNSFAKECISKHYHAFTLQDIQSFIENVVVLEKDTMREERLAFKKTLTIKYPNVCNFICDYIKKDFENLKKC